MDFYSAVLFNSLHRVISVKAASFFSQFVVHFFFDVLLFSSLGREMSLRDVDVDNESASIFIFSNRLDTSKPSVSNPLL